MYGERGLNNHQYHFEGMFEVYDTSTIAVSDVEDKAIMLAVIEAPAAWTSHKWTRQADRRWVALDPGATWTPTVGERMAKKLSKEPKRLSFYMGGCPNSGPFLVLSVIRHLAFRGLKMEVPQF